MISLQESLIKGTSLKLNFKRLCVVKMSISEFPNVLYALVQKPIKRNFIFSFFFKYYTYYFSSMYCDIRSN